MIEAKAEHSNFGTSIGSMVAGNNDGCELFSVSDDPTSKNLDKIDFDIVSSAQADKPITISTDLLSKIWNIDNSTATKVLYQDTQLNLQGANKDWSCQFYKNDMILKYKRSNSQFFTNTFFITASGVLTRGNNCAQIFVSDKGFVTIYPMISKGDYPDALHMFRKEVGVPLSLIIDPDGEQTSRKFNKFCHQVGTTLRILEDNTQWSNQAKLYVGMFKEYIRKYI